MKTTKLTQKGQITIPKRLRDTFGWTQGTDLTFIEEKNGVRIVTSTERAEIILKKMNQVQWNGPTTDELMAETRAERLER